MIGSHMHLLTRLVPKIRYHDESAGLHLLARGARNDDSQTKENGIWYFKNQQERKAFTDLSRTGNFVRRKKAPMWPHRIRNHTGQSRGLHTKFRTISSICILHTCTRSFP